MGRPNMGTTFRDLEKVTIALAPLGAKFEPKNPVTLLMESASTGKLRDEVLDERVLTAIIEFTVPESKVLEVLEVLKNVAGSIDTVFSLDIINRMPPVGDPPVLQLLKDHGYYLSPNGKVCIGIGRPSSGGEGT